jgi:tagatose-6-phosphate ketose/aldose isomerase
MNYLNMDVAALKVRGAIETAMEISGQPDLWVAIYEKVLSEEKKISPFIEAVFKRAEKIILTGAGTSAYIGYSVEGVLQCKSGVTTVSVPTTHLVSHPKDYFEASVPTLLISFARSGNSPESVAAVKWGDQYCRECYHLIITCNPDGDLAKHTFKSNSYVFMLPPKANDKSLAMTGSYSGMLLSALLMADIKQVGSLEPTVQTLRRYGNVLLDKYLEHIKKIAALPFNRVVFLGSGPHFGTATESHLKLQELTDGQVICKHDSYLGFRHGPKAVVNEHTLMVYYFSNVKEVIRYEIDLVNGMNEGKKPLFQLGISEMPMEEISIDELLVLSDKAGTVSEAYLTVATILLGQVLAFFKSLNLGLSPDSPSTSGAISRIVKGVTIY